MSSSSHSSIQVFPTDIEHLEDSRYASHNFYSEKFPVRWDYRDGASTNRVKDSGQCKCSFPECDENEKWSIKAACLSDIGALTICNSTANKLHSISFFALHLASNRRRFLDTESVSAYQAMWRGPSSPCYHTSGFLRLELRRPSDSSRPKCNFRWQWARTTDHRINMMGKSITIELSWNFKLPFLDSASSILDALTPYKSSHSMIENTRSLTILE